MPMKDFILLVVYLLVPLTCNVVKKKPICQWIASVARLTIVKWRSALKKEGKKLWKQKSWCKSEKFKATINFSVYIFLLWRNKIKNKIKVHKVLKIYYYNQIVNFEAQSSLECIFLSFFYTQKKKNRKKNNIFHKIYCIIKINAAK